MKWLQWLFFMCSEENKTNHVSCIVSAPSPHDMFSSVKHKDSASTAENTEHGLEVCISPVRHWAYNPINIFGLVKSDVFCYH